MSVGIVIKTDDAERGGGVSVGSTREVDLFRDYENDLVALSKVLQRCVVALVVGTNAEELPGGCGQIHALILPRPFPFFPFPRPRALIA